MQRRKLQFKIPRICDVISIFVNIFFEDINAYRNNKACPYFSAHHFMSRSAECENKFFLCCILIKIKWQFKVGECT